MPAVLSTLCPDSKILERKHSRWYVHVYLFIKKIRGFAPLKPLLCAALQPPPVERDLGVWGKSQKSFQLAIYWPDDVLILLLLAILLQIVLKFFLLCREKLTGLEVFWWFKGIRVFRRTVQINKIFTTAGEVAGFDLSQMVWYSNRKIFNIFSKTNR